MKRHIKTGARIAVGLLLGGAAGRKRAGIAFGATTLLCAVLAAVTVESAQAAVTINVPADQPTIAAALAVAVDGDSVVVAPGSYHEIFDFERKDVAVVTSGGPAVTTIDPPDLAHIVMGPGGRLEGFTFTGGTGGHGGVLEVQGAGSVVRGNRFVDNDGHYGGGGAVINGNSASPIIDRNWFAGNACGGDTQSSAGVLTFINSSAPSIVNNVFLDNPCEAAVNLFVTPMGTPPVVMNNTIVGGPIGIRANHHAPHQIRNNIIWGNGVGIDLEVVPPAVVPTIEHNLVSHNVEDYRLLPDQTGLGGNIGGDPAFIDRANGDVRLQSTSPAVDAGTPTGAPAVDHRQVVRPLDGDDADSDAEFDIGAYERDGTEPPPVAQPVPQSGDLDLSWSEDGISFFAPSHRIALGPTGDRGMVVAATIPSDAGGTLQISRFQPSGAPSVGWGSGGPVVRAFEPGGNGANYPSHAIPVGLRVTIVGEHHRNTARLGVARLRSDGSYDTSFSGDGRALYKVFRLEHDVVSALQVDVLSAGKIGIAVAAFDYTSQGAKVFSGQAMLRLNANGTLDTTFSGDGVAVVPNDWSEIQFLPNGGAFAGRRGSVSHEVRKLLPSGQPDRSFSADGIASAACGEHYDADLAIDPVGRLVLMCLKDTAPSITLAVYRFTTSGGFDGSYSGDGKTSLVVPDAAGEGRLFYLDATAKPWAAVPVAGDSRAARVYTLASNGSPDAAWDGDGVAEVQLRITADLVDTVRSGTRLFLMTERGYGTVAFVALKI